MILCWFCVTQSNASFFVAQLKSRRIVALVACSTVRALSGNANRSDAAHAASKLHCKLQQHSISVVVVAANIHKLADLSLGIDSRAQIS